MNQNELDELNENNAFLREREKLRKENLKHEEKMERWQNDDGLKPDQKTMQKRYPVRSKEQIHEIARDKARAGRIADEKNRKIETHTRQEERSEKDIRREEKMKRAMEAAERQREQKEARERENRTR